ncbi:carbohydrate-binding domain-containing protein [Pedobacter rhodius]|uniref:Carbohydrate-binding domain-containing protein n=1 Tax=Pedobacter rhodius TaxID=3004098 RepID=A0ABT4KXK0_9SPHI|nr:carbohydrate-binding domain-containing protein [Pedobacter sp. SJ11]MCZ4223662.1 carbohydrate-binding domain-containing protein [Pedobacter sp. SJ11]
MKSSKYITRFVFAIAFVSTILSCKKSSEETATTTTETYAVIETNTKDTTLTNAVLIKYANNVATVTNPFSGNGVTITNSNGVVTVTSTIPGTEVNYVISGVTTNGSVKIYSDYKFGLVLNGADIISKDGPAINIQSGQKATVILVGETNNRLIDAATYTASGTEDMKGTFFSNGQLMITGNGRLIVKGNYKHAICSNDNVDIKGGNIAITGAVSDGIHTNNYFQMEGGSLSITLSADGSGDGIEAETGYIQLDKGVLNISTTVNNGLLASYKGTNSTIDPSVKINGGTITITTTGEKAIGVKSEGSILLNSTDGVKISVSGNGAKGFNSGKDLTITNANVNVTTTGDAFYDTTDKGISSAIGIKTGGNFRMDKGTIAITSSGIGGKGISSDGTFVINDGTVTVSTSGAKFTYGSDNITSKAVKSTGNLTVNGGTVNVRTSGTEAEGIGSDASLTINGGTIECVATHNGLSAINQIVINGGNIYSYSGTNDGMNSNGTITITGGLIVASGSTVPEGGFDCGNNTFKITGGTLIGIGGTTSNPTANATTQNTVVFSSTAATDELIHIETSLGADVFTFKVPRAYASKMTLLFSMPTLSPNTAYTIYRGGSVAGGTNFHGLFTGSTYTKGTISTTFTTSSILTSISK